jgi:hypothetical protein
MSNTENTGGVGMVADKTISHAKYRGIWGERLLTAMIASVMVAVMAAPLMYVLIKNKAAPVASIDVQALIIENQNSLSGLFNLGQSAEARAASEKMAGAFAAKLNKVVEDIGVECKCTLINRAAVLSGTVLDYTEVARGRLK